VAGILYGALVALAQSDLKRLIAYSSVSHLGFCMLGIFALNPVALQGGALQMINHGLSTGGLFALVGMLYERYHTRQIADFGGIARETPVLAFFMVFMTLSSIGLPGLNGFVGEFLLLLGMFQRAWGPSAGPWAAHYQAISVLAVSGVVLGAWYMLWLIARVFFGPLRQRKHAEPIADLSFREVMALVPLCVVIVWIGVQPKFFLDRMAPGIDRLSRPAMRAADSPTNLNYSAEVDKREDFTQKCEGAKAQESCRLSVVGCRWDESTFFGLSGSRIYNIGFPHSCSRRCAVAPLRENSIEHVTVHQQPLVSGLPFATGFSSCSGSDLSKEFARVP
jgi:hypothetical protein